MKASTNWIFDLCPALREKEVTVEKLAHKFAHAGIAVDGVHKYGEGAGSCVLAQVVSMRPHPSRGQLNLVTVDVGGKTQEVVCGAPNVPAAGWLVVSRTARRVFAGEENEDRAARHRRHHERRNALQRIGARAQRRPRRHFGLRAGLRETWNEIHRRDPWRQRHDFRIGSHAEPRRRARTHRPRARSRGTFEIDWKPKSAAKSIFGKDGLDVVSVDIQDAERCAHYGAALVRGVKIAPSPLAIRYRLAALGVRSISNVVDVTNIAMLLSGHPMHAFDLSHVRGSKIIVRRATAGEKFKTLDGVDRILDTDDLVIADGEGAVALAGVMGGANSEIGNDTKDVLFECAYFEPRGVRRASRRHGLHTESSHRFERGVDASDTENVLADAVEVTLDLAGGKADGWKIFSARNIQKTSAKLRRQKLVALAGVEISLPQAKEVLSRLGFDVTKQDADSLEAIVPLHRPDVLREVDLIEEVTRVRGFDKIPEELPPIRSTRGAKTHETREELLRRARAAAVALGLSEAYPLGFVDPHAHEIFGAPAPSVIVKNPLSELQSVMRTSLLPGLSAAVARAAKHGERNSRIFAVGPIFLGDPNAKVRTLPEERVVLTAILSGERPAYLSKPEGVDTWDAKGVALGFVERFSRTQADVKRFEANPPKHLHPRGAASILVGGKIVGTFGPLHPDVIDALELPTPCVVAEIDVAALVEIGTKISTFVPFSRFPAATRDVALVVADAIHAGEVENVLRDAAGPLAERIELFDRFVGGSIPAGHASLAFHVVYRSREKTLTDVEVDTQHAKVVQAAQSKFGATLRA